MSLSPASTTSLDGDSLKLVFTKVDTAISRRDYAQIIESTSQALLRIHESLVTIVSHHVHALLMNGKFEEAIKDAQNVIGYEPTLATGYFWLGEIYRTQGKQQNAIDMYNIGLQSASPDNPDYTRMIYGKEAAEKQNEARVDFIRMLPIEIVDDILALLPDKSIFGLLTVSDIWRAKISRYSGTWKTWKTGNSTNIDWSTDIIEDIAANVEDLTINTTSRHVFSHYLSVMNNGKFQKVTSLTLDEYATKHISADIITPFSSAFWEIQKTLTKLVIKFSYDSAVISPTDLLLFCPNLKCLDYSAKCDLSQLIDDISTLYPHDNLIDMRLAAKSITSQNIRKLLLSCQQLRRLLLNGCDDTVLDVVDTLCPNLVTFGYNAQIEMVPEVDESDASGLRRLYTQNGGAPVSASAILPLIRRNRSTLETVYANISGKNPSIDLAATYADLKLNNLKRLTFWGDDVHIIQPLLLQSISTCTMLTQFTAVESRDIARIAQALILLPQLEILNISYPRGIAGEEDLVRLFAKYASDPPSERRLKSISFRYCRKVVTNSVLAALINIDTLENLTFEGSSGIATQGWSEFFKNLKSNLLYLNLKEIATITTATLISIGNHSSCLKSLRLERLDKISGHGILELVEKASSLESLTVMRCEYVNLSASALAKKKIRNVVVK